MNILQTIGKLWAKEPEKQAASPAAVASIEKPRSLFDRPLATDEITLGLRYVSRFAWHMIPPAGWRRQDNISAAAWPAGSVSPSVTFTQSTLKTGEQALLRWQLLATQESQESHAYLEQLLSQDDIDSRGLVRLEAPGLVHGNQVQKVENLILPTGQNALLLFTRLDQCKGEQPILRYVLLLPDRQVTLSGQKAWFRESIQYAATESAFWDHEALAIAAIKTFKRTFDESVSASLVSVSSGLQPVH